MAPRNSKRPEMPFYVRKTATPLGGDNTTSITTVFLGTHHFVRCVVHSAWSREHLPMQMALNCRTHGLGRSTSAVL